MNPDALPVIASVRTSNPHQRDVVVEPIRVPVVATNVEQSKRPHTGQQNNRSITAGDL